MNNDKKALYSKMDAYKKKCRKKGFCESGKIDKDAEMAGILALTKDSLKYFGNTEAAFDFLISIIDESNNSQELIDKISEKIGLN